MPENSGPPHALIDVTQGELARMANVYPRYPHTNDGFRGFAAA